MRVIALTGEAECCEQFIEALTHHHKVAIMRLERGDAAAFVSRSSLNPPLICIKSPTRFAFTSYLHKNVNQIPRELDHLGEQEDIEFCVVVGSTLAAMISSFREVYEATLNHSTNLEPHLEALKTVPEWMTLGALIRTVRSHPQILNAGAILTFTGTVRKEAIALEFDIYESEAEQRLSSIVDDLRTAEGIVEAKIYHKSGRVELGEDIVYIVVAAVHRQEGFKALRDAIERIKKDVPIWKKEFTENGEKWIGI